MIIFNISRIVVNVTNIITITSFITDVIAIIDIINVEHPGNASDGRPCDHRDGHLVILQMIIS